MEGDYLSVADAIESLCCVEIRAPGPMQGPVRPLALAAREGQGGPPILAAARRLAEVVGRGDNVIVATGFYVPDAMPRGESDGPPGAASLAYALGQGLGAVPLVLAEEQCHAPVGASLAAIGLSERDSAGEAGSPLSFSLRAFPTDDEAEREADDLLRSLRPKAVVVIEKPGLNALGVAHRGGGLAIAEGRMRVEVLTARARAEGILTIAIGDNGNEAGMGMVAAATRRYKTYGDVCRCPCGGGIAAVDEADVTVVASVSNWGAYGIAAMLGVLTKSESTLHTGETERRVIEACQTAGAVDGHYLDHRYAVDGIPADVNGHIVDILRSIVRTSIGGEQ